MIGVLGLHTECANRQRRMTLLSCKCLRTSVEFVRTMSLPMLSNMPLASASVLKVRAFHPKPIKSVFQH